MNKVLEELGKIGIVPVIKIDDVEKAVPLAQALKAGGIPCAEVTFRTAQGEESIRRIAGAVPGILLGAGTVLSPEQVDKAIDAGAQFIVSPGFNPRVVSHCREKGIPITPGCSNPSDIEQALEAGLEVIKFFPAEQSGGLDYIKAVSAPYPSLRFMPTGGISAANIGVYSACDKIHACGGSWMVKDEFINAGDFDRITALSREAVSAMLGFRVVHFGINAGDTEAAGKAARFFSDMFGFASKDGSSSVFAGNAIEIMKTQDAGGKKHGHIVIGTNSVGKAAAFLERRGIALDWDNAKKDAKGRIILLCLGEEIAGFAIHIAASPQTG